MVRRLVLLLAWLAATDAAAMGPGEGRPPLPPPAVLAHELDLTDEQEDQLREILATHHEQRQRSEANRREARDQLFTRLREVLDSDQFEAFLALHERGHGRPPGPSPRCR